MDNNMKKILKEQFEIENNFNVLSDLVQTLKTAFDTNIVNSEEPFYLEPLVEIISDKTSALRNQISNSVINLSNYTNTVVQ